MIVIIFFLLCIACLGAFAESYYERDFPRSMAKYVAIFLALLIVSLPIYGQTYGKVGTFVATATGQSSQAMIVSGESVAVIGVVGTGLTTVSFQVYGSIGCQVFSKILPIRTIGVTPASALSETTTVNDHFTVNVAGWDCIEVQTTGTFTATSVTFNVYASPNGVVSRFRWLFPEDIKGERYVS